MWTALALAAEPRPPELTDARLEDVSAWEKSSRVLLDGPDACVMLEGTVMTRLAVFTSGGWLSAGTRRDLLATGTFAGTLDHGVWTALATHWNPSPEGDALHMGRIHPVIGRFPPPTPGTETRGSVSVSAGGSGTNVAVSQGAAQSLGLLDQVLSAMNPSVVTSFVSWDADARAVLLDQTVPMDNRQGNVKVNVSFPEGRHPTALDALFPSRFAAGKGRVKISVHDAQFHVRSKTTDLGVLPSAEGASTVVGFLGYTVGIDQQIQYLRARACPASGE